MNLRCILVVIIAVLALHCEAKKGGGCGKKAMCKKLADLQGEVDECKARGEDQAQEIDDLKTRVDKLENPPTEPPPACQSPWVEFGSSCYLFSDSKKNWDGAVVECNGHGASLLSIQSQEEQNFVQNHLKGHSWLGMTDTANDGHWVWKSDGTAISFTNWNGGEPNGGTGENYGMVWGGGKWNDCGPGYNWNVICEKQA